MGPKLADSTRGAAQKAKRVTPLMDGFALNYTERSTVATPSVKAHWLHIGGTMLNCVMERFVLTTETDAAPEVPKEMASRLAALPAGTGKLVKSTDTAGLPELGAMQPLTHEV